MDLKNGKPVDWYSWYVSHIMSICDFYIEIGWCKRYKDRLEQLEQFQQAVIRVDDNRERILKIFLKNSPGLRTYLMIHSVFDIDDFKKGDWFVKFMINELNPTDEIIKKVHEKDHVPEEILEKLAIFNPRPLGFEKHVDNVEIRYKMYGNWRKGESSDPIVITDRAWENIGRKISQEEMEKIISSYEPITIS